MKIELISQSKEIQCWKCSNIASYKVSVFEDSCEKFDCAYACNMICVDRFLVKKGFRNGL